jgi:hypothetical protein
MRSSNGSILRVAAVAAASLFATSLPATPARAATLYWDGTDTTPGPDGGSGIWDLTTPNWEQGFPPNVTPTPWVQGSDAVLLGAPGTVTVAAPIQANSIEVTPPVPSNAGPWTITGGTITTPAVLPFSGATVTVNSSLASTGSTFIAGDGGHPGTVILNGDNSALAKSVGYGGGGGGTLIVDGNQTPNRLPKNAAVNEGGAGFGFGTFEVRGRDALPTGADAVDVNFGFPAPSSVLRVVSGASALSGTTVSHAHLRNLRFNGGTIELAYSGTGSAYNGESFVLNGDLTADASGTSRIVYGPGANAANAGIALAGARAFNVFNNIRNSGFLQVAVGLQDGDATTAPGRLIANLSGSMSLDAANTYSGGTEIHGTLGLFTFSTLFANVNGALGTGDVTLASGLLSISATDTIADSAFLFVNTGSGVSLGTGVNETVFGLAIDGVAQPHGTYGSSTSAAEFKNDQFFSGTGILTVVPEPGGFTSLALLAGLLRRRRGRRSEGCIRMA